jgi:hypothetical protein
MTEARTQTRREGNKGWNNGLPNVKVGSHPAHPLRQRGVGSWKRWTKRVPIATLPVWAFREKRPVLPERYVHFLGFSLADMPPVKSLTTFYVEEETIHAVTTVHGSYHQCTMRGHLCEETHARSRAWVSGRGRRGRAHDATQRSAGRRRPGTSPAVSRSTRSDGEGGYT